MRKTVIALAMCVTLAFSSLSTVCAASQWSAPASTTEEQKSYVEGEALAIVRGGEQLKVPGRTERIAQVSSSALQDALEDWNGSGSGAAVTNTALTKESGRQFEENEIFTIWSISDRNQTTEEILRELRTDPDVIAAEPNYIAYAANEEESEAEPEEAETSDPEEENTEEDNSDADNTDPAVTKGNLSPMQWSNGTRVRKRPRSIPPLFPRQPATVWRCPAGRKGGRTRMPRLTREARSA